MQFGIVAVASASAVVNVLDALFFLAVVVHLVGLKHADYWGALRWIGLNTAAAAIAMLAVRMLLEPSLGQSLIVLVAAAGAGVVTYLGLALVYERRYLLHMLGMLRPVALARPST